MSILGETARLGIFSALDPWISELRALGRLPSVEEIDRIVSPRAGVRFQRAEPKGRRARASRRARAPIDPSTLYDGSITERAVVSTRPGSLHDLWNALVWAAFPKAKRALHARQHARITASLTPGATTLPPARTREQDTLAMIDEGGVVLVCDRGTSASIAGALEARSTQALEDLSAQFTGLVFGHAIYEELARGPSRVLGFSVLLESSERSRDRVVPAADALLAGMLEDPERFLSPEGHRGVAVEPALFTLPTT